MRMTSYDGIYADLTDQIIRAAIEVHRELGCGLKEEAYETSDILPVAKATERRRGSFYGATPRIPQMRVKRLA